MIKGWKNNPLWVKHYQEVKDKRENAKLERWRKEFELQIKIDEIADLARRSESLRTLNYTIG